MADLLYLDSLPKDYVHPESTLTASEGGPITTRIERCPNCRGKWTVYMGCSRSWREEWHCFGCRKPVENCTC